MSHAWLRGHEEAVKGKEMCRRDCGSEGSERLKGVWWGSAASPTGCKKQKRCFHRIRTDRTDKTRQNNLLLGSLRLLKNGS